MAVEASTGRLRGELTEFVGRRAELAQVRQALATSRLVTLTGPGGIGKTRLALQAADGARRAFRDGACLAELGGLRDPALLVPEVARALGLSDQSGRWAVATLSDYLQARRLLLVLDQCEHLADACAVMADALLRACPGRPPGRQHPPHWMAPGPSFRPSPARVDCPLQLQLSHRWSARKRRHTGCSPGGPLPARPARPSVVARATWVQGVRLGGCAVS